MADTKKLIDYIKDSKQQNAEQIEMEEHVEQSSINTAQEILALKKELTQHKKAIQTAILASPFSASKLYEARSKSELAQRKYDAITKIKEELF